MSRETLSRNKSKRENLNDDDVTDDDGSVVSDSQPVRINRKRQKAHKTQEFDNEDDEATELNVENLPFEAGQIVKVYVENFMCHRKFTVDFCRHLNYVNGQNGSGKSAIVAAIQLCLGATARTTGRGSNLSNLIREGSDGPAIIQVHLLNEGADAYHPDKYGDRIIVERRISKGTGAGGYQLLSKTREVISREKRELENMLRAFNIYVDNPCCVLTQEESKKFIQGSDKDKYDFFLKATGLHRTKEELCDTLNAIDTAAGDVQKHEQRVEQKKVVAKGLQHTLERLQQLDKIEDNIKLCRAKAYWHDLKLVEFEVTAVQEVVNERQNEVNEAQTDLETAQTGDVDTSGEIEALTAALEVAQSDKAEADAADELATERVRETMKFNTARNNELDRIRKGHVDLTNRLKIATSDLAQEKRKAMNDAQQDERAIMEKLNACSEQIHRRQESENAMKTEQKVLAEQLMSMSKVIQKAVAEVTMSQKEIERLQNEAKSLANGGKDKAVLFGDRVPAILAKVKSTQFREPVFGPIGMCVSMKEGMQQWSEALERALGSVTRSFVVSNHDDRVTLSSILKSFGATTAHSIILQHKNARYNVISTIPHGIHTVADMLLIPEDQVFNALVDQISMDRTGLIHEEDDCRQFLERGQDRLERIMYNLSALITKKATLLKWNRGNQSSEMNRHGHKHILSHDSSEYINSLSLKAQEKHHELQEQQVNVQHMKSEQEQTQSAAKKIERSLQENLNEIRKLMKEKNAWDTQRQEAQQAGSVDFTSREDEINELRAGIEDTTRAITDLQVTLTASNAELKTRQVEKKAADARRNAMHERMEEHEAHLAKAIDGRKNTKRRIEKLMNLVHEKQKALDTELRNLEKATQTQQEKLTLAMNKSKELVEGWDGEPIPVRHKEDRAHWEKKEKVLRIELNEGKKQAGLEGFTIEIVSERLENALEEWRTMKHNVEQLKNNLISLRVDYKSRSQLWNHSLKANAEMTKRKFDEYIQQKGFAGTVHFDHKEHTLKMEVQTDNNDQNTKSSDVRQLSGGERSFSTFCFLLALGHVIECPFRLMDEYDVFLDEISRKLTLDQMRNYVFLPQQRNRQFIIITPNKLSDVKTSNKVKIIKMQDPKRRSAHGLQQQTID